MSSKNIEHGHLTRQNIQGLQTEYKLLLMAIDLLDFGNDFKTTEKRVPPTILYLDSLQILDQLRSF